MSTPTPDELARELGVSGKTVRAYLRRAHARPALKRRTRWHLTEAEVAAVRERFGRRWRRAESREGMVALTVALPASDHRRLARAADRLRAAMAELIRQAVSEWLGRHAPRGKR